MKEIITTLAQYFSYPFVRYALIVSIMIAISSALLGVTLVLKRFSFIGDGLSHVAFGAMAIATVLRLTSSNLIVMPITILAAILLLRTRSESKVKGDASLAMISVVSMALGYFIMNVFSTSANISGDVCSTLFGSTAILTLSVSDVWLSISTSFLVVIFYVIYYHKIFAVTFDESFAISSGISVKFYNTTIAVVSAIVIVLAMNLVGSLLITALVVFPSLSAMRVERSFKKVIILSVVISVVCVVTGLLISILCSTPVGATIVIVDAICFALFVVIGKALKIS